MALESPLPAPFPSRPRVLTAVPQPEVGVHPRSSVTNSWVKEIVVPHLPAQFHRA